MRNIIYSKYSNMRAPKFQIRTTIFCDEDGNHYVEKLPLTKVAVSHVLQIGLNEKLLNASAAGTRFVFNKSQTCGESITLEYLEGQSLSELIAEHVRSKNAEAVKQLLQAYYSELCVMAVKPFVPSDEMEQVFGKVYFETPKMSCPVTDIDMIFDNIIVADQVWNVLDYEWSFGFAIPVEYIMYRAVIHAEPLLSALFQKQDIFDFLNFSTEDLRQYALMEENFGKYVMSESEDLWQLRDMKKRTTVNEMLDHYSEDLQNSEYLKSQEEYFNQIISEKDDHIQKQNTLLEETMQNYRNLEDSYRNDIASFNNQIAQLHENNAQSHLQISREMAEMAQNMAQMTQKYVQLTDEKSAQELEKHILNAENNRLKQEKVAAETVFVRLEQENSQLQEQLTQAISAKTACAEELSSVETELATYKEHYVMAINQRDALTTSKDAVETELATYKEHYLMAIAQRDDLTQKLAFLQGKYDAITNATFWKMTKPLRVFTNFVKEVLRKNRFTRIIGKGVMSLFKHGVSFTWMKVKNKLRSRFGKQPLVGIPEQVQTVQSAEIIPVQSVDDIPQTVKFSVLVPLYNTNEKYLREMIQSVKDQIYGNWELCLADGSDAEHGYVEQICLEYANADARIRYHRLEANRGISENTNACAAMATGDYIALLDHDDIYTPDALYFNAKAILETNADVLYSDEDHLALDGTHINPFYKPDWSPDLLYSQMYICHLLVFRRSLFEAIGGYRKEFDGSQDYDLMLRFSEETEKICHIPRVLYSWRESETSTAANAEAKPYAHISGKNALDAHLKRKYGPLAHAEETEYLFVYQPRFDLTSNPLISIIIPMKDHWEMTDACIKSIFEKSTYSNYEIIVLDNRSEKDDTFAWFEEVCKDSRVRVIKADMEFNWSKINNYGVKHANGDVFVFLNNDTLVITEDWLERLAENALRPDVGVVGGLLLYEDNTIQHAGVVVGFGGWADHVFKGMAPVHYGAPFVSPMVSRNVLAVTGACVAVSRKTLEKIGPFDEEFIICGSDVELCLRAHDNGLFNRYDVNVRLYHLESKSRDSYIPEIDFKKSYEAYGPYRENIDPYFNINLDINSVIPREKVAPMNLVNFKNYIKRCPVTAPVYQAVKKALMEPANYSVAEIGPLVPRKAAPIGKGKRLNLLIPSVDKAHVFGGIATALKFYETLAQNGDFALRIITLDAGVNLETSVLSQDYVLVSPEEDSKEVKQILPMADRYNRTFPVAENDVFVATSWWSAYNINDVMLWQKETYGDIYPLIYFIQDYEPGFYPWSSRYMMADSTYRSELPVYAVINSKLLHDHMVQKGYQFTKTWYFEPTLNASLKQYLPELGTVVPKKKQILVYGRPNTARNAFELLVYGLKEWVAKQDNIDQWTILSAGEQHDDVDLGNGAILHSVGKLSLEDYAKMMLETYAGVSLMVSPHPSYPPLEMATFGAKTITNCYESKDLTDFSDNMICLKSCAPRDIAKKLLELCDAYDKQGTIHAKADYLKDTSTFGDIPQQICAEIR